MQSTTTTSEDWCEETAAHSSFWPVACEHQQSAFMPQNIVSFVVKNLVKRARERNPDETRTEDDV